MYIILSSVHVSESINFNLLLRFMLQGIRRGVIKLSVTLILVDLNNKTFGWTFQNICNINMNVPYAILGQNDGRSRASILTLWTRILNILQRNDRKIFFWSGK